MTTLARKFRNCFVRCFNNFKLQHFSMKSIFSILVTATCLVMAACSSQPTIHTTERGTQWQWDNGTIVIKTPERQAGQENVINLTAPKLEVVRVGFVGLGMRGPGAVHTSHQMPRIAQGRLNAESRHIFGRKRL